jgi:hypothetical protein
LSVRWAPVEWARFTARATGRKNLSKELMPQDATGVAGIASIAMTADARTYLYSYVQQTHDLYLVKGLK